MVGPILFDLINQPIVSQIKSHVALNVPSVGPDYRSRFHEVAWWTLS